LFTFVISLVVVGAALFFATRIAVGATPKPDKPATPVTRSVGVRHLPSEPESTWVPSEDASAVTAWRRIRSATLLLVMLTVLGALAALVIVVLGALVLSGLRSAVQ
jgi:hypothetical protein